MEEITLKPGQLCTINNKVYRAEKKKEGYSKCFSTLIGTKSCAGCSFNSLFMCPALKLRGKGKKIDCWTHNIILKKV